MQEEISQLSAEYVDATQQFIDGVRREEGPFIEGTVEDHESPDIKGPYQFGSGGFWIALTDGDLIGTVGLVDLGGGHGCLQKMYVHSDFRGTGIAQRLLNAVVDHAISHQITEIFLGTHSRQSAARRFYEKNGFRPLLKERIPRSFPSSALEDCFYHRVLATE